MALVNAQLLDGSGTTLFETTVDPSDGPDAVLDGAARTLHAAACAVADGTITDVRSVLRVASVQVANAEPVSLDALIGWMMANGRAGEAAVITTALAEGVEWQAATRRNRFSLIPR